MDNQYSHQLHYFITTYRPPEGPDRSAFIEDLRKLLVLDIAHFRSDQKNHHFTDKTGDKFIQGCLETLTKGA